MGSSTPLERANGYGDFSDWRLGERIKNEEFQLAATETPLKLAVREWNKSKSETHSHLFYRPVAEQIQQKIVLGD